MKDDAIDTSGHWNRKHHSQSRGKRRDKTGTPITVLSSIGGNVIVNVKDSRVAINEDMARHIMI